MVIMLEPPHPADYSVKWVGNKQKRMGSMQKKLANLYRRSKNPEHL